jgi:anti-anti-sigma regulatory factor
VNCTPQIEGSKGALVLEGCFTFEAGADFTAKAAALLNSKNLSELHVDLAKVPDLESSALGVLLLLREKAEAAGIPVVLKGPNPAVRAALGAVHFETLFEIRN